MDRIVTSSAPARLLTTEERRQWDEDGYLHIRNALSPSTVASLLSALSALHERFPLSLGHGVAPNRSGSTRVSVILRYGQAFCRPVDYWTTPGQPILDQLTPRRRRLLGDLGSRSRPGDFYGAIPDQLELMYGDRWSTTDEARADLALSAADQQAYEAS